MFMRNGFETVGKWGIPLMKKQPIDTDNLRLIACSDTKSNDRKENRLCGVHFFVDDYRFSGIFDNPERTFPKYAQYAFLLSPDFSLYADMDLWRQMESVAKNRWCGAYWQSRGQTAIPSISWSTARSDGLFSRDKIVRMAGNSIPVKLLEGIFLQILQMDDMLHEYRNYCHMHNANLSQMKRYEASIRSYLFSRGIRSRSTPVHYLSNADIVYSKYKTAVYIYSKRH